MSSLSIVSITLNIQNNRSYPQRISVLGSPVNPLDTANAKTEYRWDVTALLLSNSETLTLQYKPIGSANFSLYTSILLNPTIESILSALDNLGIGFFQYYTELGQNYFSTYNDEYIFGNLTIDPNGAPATTTLIPPTTTIIPTTIIPPTTTIIPPIVCGQWQIINSNNTTTVDYYDCSGNFQTMVLMPNEIVGCFNVDSNGFGLNQPFQADFPITQTPCPIGISYDVSPSSALTAGLACALLGNIQLYAIEATPLTVTRFYTDVFCTVAFSGDTNYYRYQLTGGGGSYTGQINLGGFVTNISGCP